MAKHYSISSREDYVLIAFDLPPDLPALREVAVDLIENFIESRQFLWDFSNGFALTPDEMREIADGAKKVAPRTSRRVAIVAPEDLNYGLLRIFEVYREKEGSQVKVFRNRELASEWISST
ncbi:MAG: hypothetical protein ACR2PZ_27340 [Pseudomonadales bacterium]